MGLTRASSGLVFRNEFSASGEKNSWTIGGTDTWAVTGGKLVCTNSGWTGARRADVATAKCATVRYLNRGSNGYCTVVGVGGSGDQSATYHDCNGYAMQFNTGETALRLYKTVAGTSTLKASGTADAYTDDALRNFRIYIASGVIKCMTEDATTGVLEQTISYDDSAGSPFTEGHVHLRNAGNGYSSNEWEWIEGRTAHTITCSGLSTGWYLKVSDGTTTAKAAESSGTATVDAGAVLFPLATVGVYDGDPDSGGTLVEEYTHAMALLDGVLDAQGNPAPLGGGDPFVYSAATAVLHNLTMMGAGTA